MVTRDKKRIVEEGYDRIAEAYRIVSDEEVDLISGSRVAHQSKLVMVLRERGMILVYCLASVNAKTSLKEESRQYIGRSGFIQPSFTASSSA